MKKILSTIILFFLTTNLSANDRNVELDKLFLELKKSSERTNGAIRLILNVFSKIEILSSIFSLLFRVTPAELTSPLKFENFSINNCFFLNSFMSDKSKRRCS